jgi:WD40 repeat protein
MPANNAPLENRPAGTWHRIDEVVMAFEDAWRLGPPPTIDDFLPTDGPDNTPVLRELVHVDLERRWSQGEAAGVEDYLRRFPQLQDDPGAVSELIAAEFRLRCEREPGLDPVLFLKRFPGHESALLPRPSHFPEECLGANVGSRHYPAQKATASDGGSPRPQVPGYAIEGELGVGGMGVVFRARQVSLNRLVALKMIRSGAWAAGEEVQRFRNEAEAAAGLDHPNIVAVHEVGSVQGQLYYTMRLVEGHSLAQHLARFRDEPRRAALLMATVARAVHHAHQRGVLHRDLKPSNILVDGAGQPHVTDFGLAKRVAGDMSLTQTGALVGTPGYMAPEQTGGGRGPVSVACDVYSLGAVLYALLAGRAPFRGEHVLEVLEQTRSREPDSLSGQNGRVDRDLETITRKCLEKDPSRRYPSAQALAEDLERWLDGKPIEARRPTRTRRLWMWSRRHPSLALLSAAVAVLVPLLIATLATAVVIVGGERDDAREQRERMREQRERMREQRERTRENLYAADMGLAYRAWLQGDMAQLARLLDEWQPQPEASDLRDFAWRFLDSLRRGQTRTPPAQEQAHKGAIYRMAFSPDGRTLASASKDGTVRLKTTGGRPILLLGHTAEVNWVAFDREGSRLATASDDGTARVWDAASGKQLLCVTVPEQGQEVVAAEFTTDGRALLTGDGPLEVGKGGDGHVRLWQLPSGAPSPGRPLTTVSSRIEGLAVAPDGTRVASVTKDGRLVVRDTVAHGGASERFVAPGEVSCVAYAPDGRSLVVGDRHGNVRLFRASDGAQEALYVFEEGGGVEAVAFAPDRRTLAACGRAGRVRLWDLRSGIPRRKLDCKGVRLWCLTFSPDGRTLLAGGDDGAIRSWDLSQSPVPQYLPAPAGDVCALAFASDGATLAVATCMGLVSFWDPASLSERPGLGRLEHRSRGSYWLEFAADGKALGVLTHYDLCLWDPVGPPQLAQRPHGGPRLIARREVEKGSGMGLCRRPGHPEWTIWRKDQPLLRWDAATGQDLPTGVEGEPCGSAAWSADGTTLAVNQIKRVRLLRPGTRETIDLPADKCFPIASSPEGATVATGHNDGIIRLWDATAGGLRRELAGHRMRVAGLAFSPGGRVLASGGWDGTVRLWHLASGREHFTLPAQLGGSVNALAFAPGGSLLAAAYLNGRDREGVALWRATPP